MGNQFLTGNAERDGTRPGCNEDVPTDELVAFDLNGVRAGEACRTMKGIDAENGVMLFLFGRYAIGEASLERHQGRPVDLQVAVDAMRSHAPGCVERLLAANQHLLGVAPAQRAGAAERPVIDDRDAPAALAHSGDHHLSGGARTDGDQIIGFSHSRRRPDRPGSAGRARHPKSRRRSNRRAWAGAEHRIRCNRRSKYTRRSAWFRSLNARNRGRSASTAELVCR